MPVVRVGHGLTATRLAYDRDGTGEPLLFVTGFAISSEIFTVGLAAYTAGFDTVRYDNRGAGRSAAPLRPTSIAELAGDAVGLLDALGIDAAHVYGLSMGGMIAQEMAIRFPHRVRGLVLGGTSPGGPRAVLPGASVTAALAGRGRTGRGGTRQGRTRRDGTGLGAPARLRVDVLAGALFSPQFRADHPEQVRAALRLLGEHRASARGLGAHWWASFFHDTYARLPRIAAPTLVLHGADDRLVPPANARILAERIPDATLHLVPGAGHAYHVERPELSYRLFREWMDARAPIPAGPPPGGLARRTEPITRALGLPVGVARTGRSLAALSGSYLQRGRLSGR